MDAQIYVDVVDTTRPKQQFTTFATTAGFADSYGIVEGDRVRWKRTDD